MSRLLKSVLCLILVNMNASLIAEQSSNSGPDIQFNSQAGQDEFVYTLLYRLMDKQGPGYYLELGGGDPIVVNNTYAFEKECNWEGISIEIESELISKWLSTRKNPILHADALKIDYTKLLKEFPVLMDYLSLDIDFSYVQALNKVLESNHVFKVITIEHDFYRYRDTFRAGEREALERAGYLMIAGNIRHKGNAFEDWWIYPKNFREDLILKLQSLELHDLDWRESLEQISALIVETPTDG